LKRGERERRRRGDDLPFINLNLKYHVQDYREEKSPLLLLTLSPLLS